MPSEKPPTRLRATDSSPVSSMTSRTRCLPKPCVAAIARRWFSAVRPVCTAFASSSAPTSRSGARCCAYCLAVDRDAALARAVEADDHAHGGRLAGAVRAEEAGDLAGAHRERDVVDGGLRAEALGESFCSDHDIEVTDAATRAHRPPEWFRGGGRWYRGTTARRPEGRRAATRPARRAPARRGRVRRPRGSR